MSVRGAASATVGVSAPTRKSMDDAELAAALEVATKLAWEGRNRTHVPIPAPSRTLQWLLQCGDRAEGARVCA
jgi:hypothetical protein